jgi:hypothetical protein
LSTCGHALCRRVPRSSPNTRKSGLPLSLSCSSSVRISTFDSQLPSSVRRRTMRDLLPYALGRVLRLDISGCALPRTYSPFQSWNESNYAMAVPSTYPTLGCSTQLAVLRYTTERVPAICIFRIARQSALIVSFAKSSKGISCMDNRFWAIFALRSALLRSSLFSSFLYLRCALRLSGGTANLQSPQTTTFKIPISTVFAVFSSSAQNSKDVV